MNTKIRSSRLLGALCLAGALVPGLAFAAGTPSSAPPPATSSTGQHVFQRLSRRLDNGCTYVALIRGEMSRNENDAYSAQLRVVPRVQCPGKADLVGHVRNVRFTDLRRDIAEAHIDMAARVPIVENGVRCHFTPEFSLRPTNITNRNVTFACAPSQRLPFGGGPAEHLK